ncbi:MAG: hypothetical protein R3Y23_04130 [Bacillota bacterium]
MSEKTYYYPLGDDRTKKYHYPISKFIRMIGRNIICHGYKVEGAENIPAEPAIFAANHAKLVGPMAMEVCHKRSYRVWSVSRMLEPTDFSNHIVTNVFPNIKGFGRKALYGLAVALSYPFTRLMLSYEPIPVYKDTRILNTFRKSAQTICEGKDIVLFPECKDRAEGYNYVNQVVGGVAITARECLKTSKKPISIVPVYVCQSLKKVVYCKPIVVENVANFKAQTATIIEHIMNEIEGAGKALPPHRITPYDNTYKNDNK